MPDAPADPTPARRGPDEGLPPDPSPVHPAAWPQPPLRLPLPARFRLLVRRGIQLAVDLTLVAAACLVPLLTLLAAPRNPDGSLAFLITIPWVCLVLLACVVITWWYWAWWPASRGGRTPGMRLVHLRVVDASGAPASRGQLALRWLALLVDLAAFCAVGALAILLTPRGQRFGDLLASTVVVDAHSPALAGAETRAG